MQNQYKQVSDERFKIIMTRCDKFAKSLTADTEPVKVFDPLSDNLIKELEMIREVSKDLQLKKVEDLNKAEKAAKEAEEAAQKAALEAAKEVEKEDA